MSGSGASLRESPSASRSGDLEAAVLGSASQRTDFARSGPDSVTCSAPQPRQNGAERSSAVGGCVGKNAAKAIKT